MRDILKMIGVLSLICGLSGLTLATLKDATQQKIEEQVLIYVQKPSIEAVLSGFDNDPIKDRAAFEVPGTGEKVVVFPAMAGGKLAGLAFETSAPGYGGDIGVMVGFDPNADKLAGIGITTMKETPGVGTRVAGHGFVGQFKGHSLEGLALSSKGGTVEAVAGATISSTGASEAARKAAEIYQALKKDIAAKWPMG